MNTLTKKFSALATISLIFLLPNGAAAASGAHHAPTIADLLFPAINFVLYVFALWYLLRKPLPQALAQRRANIEESVVKAKRRLDNAKELINEAEGKIRNLNSHIEQLDKNIRVETEREVNALITSGKDKASRILSQAKQTAKQEQLASETELRKELGELVMVRVKAQLEKEITPDVDAKFRERGLKDIGVLLQ